MSKLISLRTHRKQAKRAKARAAADQNAALHGRSKAQTAAEQAQAARASRYLDGHRRDDTDTGR
ncbi:MAG: DUF4169 family protein [Rhodobacteraceae bacterium]|nr:DUF4169 family protein [Paracoccaceae bacterium]